MTPEQQKEMQAAQEAYAKASPEQKKAIQAAAMAQMTPEQKQQAHTAASTCQAMECGSQCQSRAAYRPPAHRTHLRRRAACLGRLREAVLTWRLLTTCQAEAAQRGMQDMSAFCERIKPDPAEPDKALSTCDMITALASCPSFALIGEQCNAATIDAIEAALLENAQEADAAGLRDNTESPTMRRNVLLLFWALYRLKCGDTVEVDAMSEQQLQRAKQLATKALMLVRVRVSSYPHPRPRPHPNLPLPLTLTRS